MLKNKGFTLIEIMAVLAILSAVTIITVPKILNTSSIAKEHSIISQMKDIAKVIESYCTVEETKGLDCTLCLIKDDVIIWSGADKNQRHELINNMLPDHIIKKIPNYLTIKVTLNENKFLTNKGYGSISIWYPSISEDNNRISYTGIKVQDFKKKSYNSNGYKSLAYGLKIDNDIFALDINNNNIINDEDFIICNTLFKLNPSHSHLKKEESIIEGNDEDNTIHGTPNIDRLYGYGGNDKIYGYESSDKIYGGKGDDLVDSGSGNDYIDGGAGTDSLILKGSYKDYTITGFNPYIILSSTDKKEVVNVEYLILDDITDTVENIISLLGNNAIHGTIGNDNPLSGTPEEDIIYAYSGEDFIYALESNDIVYAGLGNDSIVGGLGNDKIYGGEGIDTAIYLNDISNYAIEGNNPYYVHGPEGSDILFDIELLKFADITGEIDDFINNNTGIIKGTNDNDNPLVGTPDKDIIYAYDGDDIIYGLASNDLIYGGKGYDTCVFNGYYVYYKLINDKPIIISGEDGNDTLYDVEKLRFMDEEFYINDFSNAITSIIDGTDNDDNLLGSYFTADVFRASNGNDVIRTRWGLDTIVFEGNIDDYTIIEGDGFEWSSVIDSEGNTTYYRSLFTVKLQFYNDVYFAK